jgi:hypothetical protein
MSEFIVKLDTLPRKDYIVRVFIKGSFDYSPEMSNKLLIYDEDIGYRWLNWKEDKLDARIIMMLPLDEAFNQYDSVVKFV